MGGGCLVPGGVWGARAQERNDRLGSRRDPRSIFCADFPWYLVGVLFGSFRGFILDIDTMALLCEYEQERLRNIARNQARMQQLLGGLPLKAPPPALAAKQHEKQNPSSKKKLPVKRKTTEDGAAEGAEASHWVRRSTRNIPPPPSLQASAGTHNASATTRDLPPPPPADAFVSVDTWRRTHGSSHGGETCRVYYQHVKGKHESSNSNMLEDALSTDIFQ